MVNLTTQIDGQAVATIPEAEDADEPPIGGLKSQNLKGPPLDILYDGYSVVDGRSNDGTLVNGRWDGNAGTAHLIDAMDIAAQLEVDPKFGLSNLQATNRLARDGFNQTDKADSVSIGQILLRQVSNSLTIVLLAAMALSYGTLDFIEGGVISAVILLNIVLGFVQDFRAENTMKSLRRLAALSSEVIRNNGMIETIKTINLVVGDIVRLTTGTIVPADLRMIESSNLEIEEAALTGESLPVSKHAEVINSGVDCDIAIGDRSNMAYSSTKVTKGRATAIVVAIGMQTQFGDVARLLRNESDHKLSKKLSIRFFQKLRNGIQNILGLNGTPMQVKLSIFAILLFGLAILLALIVFSVNKWELSNEVVLYGICVAVAVIPESLIAVMTITIAIGIKAMAAGHVVVRNKAALEAIGGVTAICSDKTGTLTQGKMSAHKVWVPGFSVLKIADTTNILDPNDGSLSLDEVPLDKTDSSFSAKTKRLGPVLRAIALCNFATVFKSDTDKVSSDEKSPARGWTATGDPTEIALQVLAMRFHRGKEALIQEENLQYVMDHQFDSSLKRMSIAYKKLGTDQVEVSAKGASEAIIPNLDILDQELSEINSILEKLASEGLRVLCIATKVVPLSEEHNLYDRSFMESGLKLQGLVGLHDPPRVETLGAVEKCHRAGIQVHMLTGDHMGTASAIAEKVGILKPGTQSHHTVMRAQEFDKLSDTEIDSMPSLPLVLARCSPTTKVRMVDALRRRKAYCVMTGDGVNDAPALKKADVGIAMGLNGTDVAKEAADMILTDDNFASIVKAVEEGRRLFDNIQKFLLHLLISNIAQVILLLIALAFKDADGNSVFPLSPLEILWVNMITSSFLAIGLGMEEAQADIMIRPPRNSRLGVFTWELITDKMIYGSFAGILCLVAFISVVYGEGHANLGFDCNNGWDDTCDVVFRGRATVFAVLSFLLLVTAWEVKHFTLSLFNLDPSRFNGPFSVLKALAYNRFLMWAVFAGFAITFPVIYIPVVNTVVFKHKAITWEWGVVAGSLVAYITLVEAWKACKRRWGLFSVGVVKCDGESVV